ncbi:MAG TPA: HEAT repeat domain-containing protein, partial [Planctomycetota bacterium]|nr:HEAT repeat domain-containing protein [Planctomycetota bacterium]
YADGLVRALDQASPNAKFDLIGALGRTQLRDKWNVIAPYLRDDLPELRAAAAAALGDLGAAEASEALVSQAAAETDGRVKIRIAGAAKTLFVKGAIDPLLRWLRDDSEVVRTESSAALETLTGQKFGLDTAKWDAWWADNRPK